MHEPMTPPPAHSTPSSDSSPPDGALRATSIVDCDHVAVQEFAHTTTAGMTDTLEKAVRLYYAVRDGYRYDPYRIELTPHGMRASTVLANGYGWCVPKAVLLAAACRAVGIAARVGLADVRNHMSTARLREEMGTDVFYRHGYTAILLNGKWVKATPAFNVELCQKMRLHPLEFDGREDSVYHPFDIDGHRHMEYIALQGEHDELPLKDIIDTFRQHYPRMGSLQGASWDDDVAAEN